MFGNHLMMMVSVILMTSSYIACRVLVIYQNDIPEIC